MRNNLVMGLSNSTRYYLARLRERLWFRPFLSSLLSMAGVLAAGLADHSVASSLPVPNINADSIETLLKILSASMLVIAVFAVGAMIAAYDSASASATPRSFPLVVGDDVSQNALSTFIGAFIFSILALVALLNGGYETSGRFMLFGLTLFVFAVVIVSFMRWVDQIARLGRLGNTIEKVESATRSALALRHAHPTLGAREAQAPGEGTAIYPGKVGYVQNIKIERLQCIAEELDGMIVIQAPPGTFVFKGLPMAYVDCNNGLDEEKRNEIADAFVVGPERTFESDPIFGLSVLSEIACRALSPGINDPGTAKGIIGTLVRLLGEWTENDTVNDSDEVVYPNVAISVICVDQLFDTAFNAIARDGAACVEVAARLQEAFYALSIMGDEAISRTAVSHAGLARSYAEQSLLLEEERVIVRSLADKVLNHSNSK